MDHGRFMDHVNLGRSKVRSAGYWELSSFGERFPGTAAGIDVVGGLSHYRACESGKC